MPGAILGPGCGLFQTPGRAHRAIQRIMISWLFMDWIHPLPVGQTGAKLNTDHSLKRVWVLRHEVKCKAQGDGCGIMASKYELFRKANHIFYKIIFGLGRISLLLYFRQSEVNNSLG